MAEKGSNLQKLICSRCGSFLNRPVQTDGILIKNGKVLLLRKSIKILENIYAEHFLGDYLDKKLGTGTLANNGYYVLPGHAVRKEETLEESILRTFYDETGLKTKIIGVPGVYSNPQRDPKSCGVSISFSLKEIGGCLTKSNLITPEWHDLKNLPETIVYDHKKMIEDAASLIPKNKIHLNSLSTITDKVYERKLRRTPDALLCPRCGQFNSRPAQTDGILYKDGKVLLIRRRRKFLDNELGKSHPQKYLEDAFATGYMSGWHAIPGGYVRRERTVEDTLASEFQEETGIKVKLKELIGIFSDLDRDPKSDGISMLYEVEYISGKPKASSETLEVRWYEVDNLPKTVAYDHLDMIKLFLKKKQTTTT